MKSIDDMSLLYTPSGSRKIDSAETAQQLVKKLDTSAHGYLELPDNQSAITKVYLISETVNLGTDTYDGEELFLGLTGIETVRSLSRNLMTLCIAVHTRSPPCRAPPPAGLFN
jgi:hypothetical protein